MEFIKYDYAFLHGKKYALYKKISLSRKNAYIKHQGKFIPYRQFSKQKGGGKPIYTDVTDYSHIEFRDFYDKLVTDDINFILLVVLQNYFYTTSDKTMKEVTYKKYDLEGTGIMPHLANIMKTDGTILADNPKQTVKLLYVSFENTFHTLTEGISGTFQDIEPKHIKKIYVVCNDDNSVIKTTFWDPLVFHRIYQSAPNTSHLIQSLKEQETGKISPSIFRKRGKTPKK